MLSSFFPPLEDKDKEKGKQNEKKKRLQWGASKDSSNNVFFLKNVVRNRDANEDKNQLLSTREEKKRKK